MRGERQRHNQFAPWLDITLDNLGIAGRTLAEDLGVHDSTVSRWRFGGSVPNAQLITALAERLDLNPLRLLVTAGHVSPQVAGVKPYGVPKPTAQRESVRRQISHIRGLSDNARSKLLTTYDELVAQADKEQGT